MSDTMEGSKRTAQRVAELRSAMLAEVRPEDLAVIMRKLIELAGEGNLQAAKLVLSYTLGKPEPAVKAESSATVGVKSPVGGGSVSPLPASLGVSVQELLKGAPSPNGIVDDLRELRVVTLPTAGKDQSQRKK